MIKAPYSFFMGTKSKKEIEEIKKSLKAGTWVIHNEPKMKVIPLEDYFIRSY
jgi:hypothetical protein